MPHWWRAADERHDRGFLDAVELALRPGTRIITERCLQASLVVPISHALHLTVVPADRLRSRPDRQPAVEVFERQDAPPHAGRELLLFQPLQLGAIGSRQLQPRSTLRLDLHPNA